MFNTFYDDFGEHLYRLTANTYEKIVISELLKRNIVLDNKNLRILVKDDKIFVYLNDEEIILQNPLLKKIAH